MPVITYAQDNIGMPALDSDQVCDVCGAVKLGARMFFGYFFSDVSDVVKVLCHGCYDAASSDGAPFSHCWADEASQYEFGSEEWAAVVARGGGTCMLERGHDGPCEFIPDTDICVSFDGDCNEQ